MTREQENQLFLVDSPEVFLSKADGMPQDCAVNCDHLQTVSKGKIGALITFLPLQKMVEVGRAIRFALDI
jgi:mRNA interferase MazF